MRRIKLLGIAGKAGCGKDTLAKHIVTQNYDEHDDAGPRIYSFARPIKAALNAMFGWTWKDWADREWKETVIPWLGHSPRFCAQTLGTEWGRDLIHSDLWVAIANQKLKSLSEFDSLIIPDLRFVNEAEWIKSVGGVTVYINRPGCDGSVGQSGHVSEAGFDESLIDIRIENNGTLEEFLLKSDLLLKQWAEG